MDAAVPDAPAETSDAAARCADGFPRGTPGEPRLVAKLSPAPEGVAVCANGDVFVSLPEASRIVRVPLDAGEPKTYTTMPGRQPLGMTCVGNTLYVADFRGRDAAVLRVAGPGDPGTPLPTLEGDDGYRAMNAVAWVPGVGLFATDATNTLSGRIVRFAETSPGTFTASVASKGLAFPNGITFAPKAKTLDVALTLGSRVVSHPVGAGGLLGKGTDSFAGTPVLDAIDGIARDENDALYVAHYLGGFVGRTPGSARIVSAKEPRSLAFRGGTLLVTSADGLHAVDVGVCGGLSR